MDRWSTWAVKWMDPLRKCTMIMGDGDGEIERGYTSGSMQCAFKDWKQTVDGLKSWTWSQRSLNCSIAPTKKKIPTLSKQWGGLKSCHNIVSADERHVWNGWRGWWKDAEGDTWENLVDCYVEEYGCILNRLDVVFIFGSHSEERALRNGES